MRTQILKYYALSLLVSAVILTGCGTDKYQENKMQEERSEPALGTQQEARQTNPTTSGKLAQEGEVQMEPQIGGQEVLPSQTIPQNAQSTVELSTFISLVKRSGLLSTLNGTGPYTVFAPSNKAFEALPDNTLEDLTKPANKEQLVALLNNHIVAGKLDATVLQDGSKIKTLGNGQLDVTKRQENVTINGAEVITPDVESSNGVMHIVDKVLLPQNQSL